MSLAAKLAPLARRLITPEGTALVFSRTAATLFDPIANLSSPTVTTWPAVGMFLKAKETATVRQVDGQRVVTRTLLVPGIGVAQPRPGDVVTANGTTYTVADVDVVAQTDGGTAPLYRVTVTG